MAKKEIRTDFWVYELLKDAGIEDKLTPQGSDISQIDNALKTASKKGTGKVGFPEYIGVVKDFVNVIENKASADKHIVRDEKNLIAEDIKSITDYAVNGALFYGKHIIKNKNYKKVIALGISGNKKIHKISPLFIDEREGYEELIDLETLISFGDDNILEYYYTKEILKEEIDVKKETAKILKNAQILHEDIRNYGNIKDKNKPLIVSSILLALKEIEYGFSLDNLTGNDITTDGQKIYNQIKIISKLRETNE